MTRAEAVTNRTRVPSSAGNKLLLSLAALAATQIFPTEFNQILYFEAEL